MRSHIVFISEIMKAVSPVVQDELMKAWDDLDAKAAQLAIAEKFLASALMKRQFGDTPDDRWQTWDVAVERFLRRNEKRCVSCGGWLDRPDDPSSDAYHSGMCQVCLHGPLNELIATDLAKPLDPQVGACACRGAGCWFCR